MKCPHCGKDIKEGLVTSESARIQGRRSKRKLTSEEARKMALRMHELHTKPAQKGKRRNEMIQRDGWNWEGRKRRKFAHDDESFWLVDAFNAENVWMGTWRVEAFTLIDAINQITDPDSPPIPYASIAELC